MAAQTDRGVPLSALCPKFLHTNSTSHTWPFSAIAELIDNAYDPDVKARQFWIDKTRVKEQDCLTFMDNGAGMEYEKMHKMLSFGFSNKQTINGHVPVGLYGNGFKSGSMRLGKDAIVFSKKAGTMCVGMLSQTYLQNIGAENVIVPVVTFKQKGNTICPEPEHEASLQDILRHSLFQTIDELNSELKAIVSPCFSSSTGTRIIIWNLRKMLSGVSEFDFEQDRYDIRIPTEVYESTGGKKYQVARDMQLKPESTYSLRAYCRILYLKPRMQIIIRGQKVKTQLVSKSLAHIIKDKYKPLFLDKPIQITFGYNTRSKEQYGIMMYHKNRLIKAYERVGCQLRANNIGVGVIGVITCDFLQPTHNKQDFDSTEEYRKTINNVGIKLEEYWKEIHHRLNSSVPVEDIEKRPDQNWVQCVTCLKWRKLPDGIDINKLPDEWFCHLNPDPQFRSCTVEEEPEDSEDESTRNQKTYKQHEKNKKIQLEMKRQQTEQEKKKAEQEKMRAEMQKKKAEQERIAALEKHNDYLLKKQQDLERQLRFSTPPITRSSTQEPLTPNGARPSDKMPVISDIISLSQTTPTRMKRVHGMRSENGEKKRRRIMNSFQRNIQDSPLTSTVSPSYPSTPIAIPNNGDVKLAWKDKEAAANDNDDDDIVILENASTPRPKQETFDILKVKLEPGSVGEGPALQMECGDVGMETSGVTTARTACSASSKQVSMTTQTDQRPAVKEEAEDSGANKGKEGSNEGERDNKEVEAENDLPVAARRTIQEPEVAESMQVSLSPQVSVTSLEKENESKCAKPEWIQGKSKEEPNDGEKNIKSEVEKGENTSATLKDPLLDMLCVDSSFSVLEVQQQQDNLLEMLEVASLERDESQRQVQLLTSKVEELMSNLREITQKTVKKEQCQQSTQTLPEEDQDYRSLYLQASAEKEKLRHELDQLKKEKADRETQVVIKREEAQNDGNSVDDEFACQVDSLLRELDERNKEREELKKKLDSLEDEKNTLFTCCENLQRDLEEIKRVRKNAKVSVEDREAQIEVLNLKQQESEAGPAQSSMQSGANQDETHGSSERESAQEDTLANSLKLRELRQRVGRLLITFVPALDLEQVNYDCEVIDEILGQVLDEISLPK